MSGPLGQTESAAIGYTHGTCFSEPSANPAQPSPKPFLREGPLAIDVSPVQPPVVSPALDDEIVGFAKRWDVWRAKGIAHDRAVRRKLAFAVPIAVIVAALVIVAILAR